MLSASQDYAMHWTFPSWSFRPDWQREPTPTPPDPRAQLSCEGITGHNAGGGPGKASSANIPASSRRGSMVDQIRSELDALRPGPQRELIR
jgi:hypothetical protein